MKETTKKMFDKNRALSWSAINSFEYNPEQWYESYVLGIRQTSPELTFGSVIDKRIQVDKNFLPDLPRYPLMQHRMEAKFGKIPLVGLPDGLCFDTYMLADYKTGKKAWDQKRADETGQLTMYLLLVYLTKKIKPEKFRCFIHWLPTQERGDFTIGFTDTFKVETFETKRTMRDILNFGMRINKTLREMEEYCLRHD